MPRFLASVLVLLALVLTGTACERRPDDEMVRPSVTETAAAEVPADLPELPVGAAGLDLAGRVTVVGSSIQALGRRVDVSPMRVDEHVVTPGGIYFLNGEELWFTDLARITPTPYEKVRALELSGDGRQLSFVDLEHGAADADGTPRELQVRYDAGSGKPLGAEYLAEVP